MEISLDTVSLDMLRTITQKYRDKPMKYLILKYIDTIDDMVSFEVHDQSHRSGEFGTHNSCVFKSSHGFIISSYEYPDLYDYDDDDDNSLYVRGSRHDYDTVRVVTMSTEMWLKIKEAVQEYNDYYGYKGECILGELPNPILPEELFTL